jgi:hypothetical protein
MEADRKLFLFPFMHTRPFLISSLRSFIELPFLSASAGTLSSLMIRSRLNGIEGPARSWVAVPLDFFSPQIYVIVYEGFGGIETNYEIDHSEQIAFSFRGRGRGFSRTNFFKISSPHFTLSPWVVSCLSLLLALLNSAIDDKIKALRSCSLKELIILTLR